MCTNLDFAINQDYNGAYVLKIPQATKLRSGCI